MKIPKPCHRCDTPLIVGQNIPAWRVRKHDHICTPCYAERQRAWRAAHAESERARNRDYRKNNPEKVKQARGSRYARLEATPEGREKVRARSLLKEARKRARDAGVPCTITLSWVEQRLARGVCGVTGLPLIFGASGGACPQSPSLDKLVPELGYTPSNTVLVCWGLNVLKGVDTDYGYTFDFIRAAAEALNRPGPAITEENT